VRCILLALPILSPITSKRRKRAEEDKRERDAKKETTRNEKKEANSLLSFLRISRVRLQEGLSANRVCCGDDQTLVLTFSPDRRLFQYARDGNADAVIRLLDQKVRRESLCICLF